MSSTQSRTPSAQRRRIPTPALAGAAVIGTAALVGTAMLLRTVPVVADFIEHYPGVATTVAESPTGFPAWVTWQHFLNYFFLALIIRTGIASRRETRPLGYWSSRRRSGSAARVRLTVFAHLSLDLLWMLNGVIYVLLLFATGRWLRLVPTDWDVVPHAVSVALQYASLNWPTEDGWIHYNALQQLAYFGVVFLLAPASILTGLRLSPVWPKAWPDFFPLDRARPLHFLLMLGFVLFVIGHVALVMLTGATANLNHMFAGTDQESWVGIAVFAVAILGTAGAVFGAARPLVVRTWAALFGQVTR